MNRKGLKRRLLFLWLIYFFHSTVFAQTDLRFERLTTTNGLAHNNVRSILQDRKGHLWFGTYGGISRYDGHSFKTYKYDPSDSTSLANNHNISLWEDHQGILWVATSSNGLCKFNPATEKFTRYQAKPHQPGALHASTVTAVIEDNQRRLWVGTKEGLVLFDRKNEKFIRFKHNPADASTISTNGLIWQLYKGKSGTIWIGTWEGLNRMNLEPGRNGQPNKITFTRFLPVPGNKNSLSHKKINAIFEDHTGELWVGTANGLNRYHARTGTFTCYLPNPAIPGSISGNVIKGIAEDKAGNLWISTTSGLNKLNPTRTHFTTYHHNSQNPNSISSNILDDMVVDKAGILWVGTEDAGVVKLDPNKRQISFIQQKQLNSKWLNINEVKAICEDKTGQTWIGTARGLHRYDKKKKTFTSFLKDEYIESLLLDREGNLWVGVQLNKNFSVYQLNPQTGQLKGYWPYNEKHDYEIIFAIYEDQKGLLWFGTVNGLKSYDRRRNQWQHYPHDAKNPRAICDYWVRTISEDRNGNIWAGTGNGLSKFNRESGHFTTYRNDPKKPGSLIYNEVHTLFRDSRQRLWIGTDGGGLCLYQPATDDFTLFTEADGLPDNAIHNIVEDNEGYLWLNTNKGLCRFSPETRAFIPLDFNEGEEGNYFVSGNINRGGSFKGQDGTLYFGGKHGFTFFQPGDLTFNQVVPPVVLTQIKLFDKVLKGSHNWKELKLKHNQNFISFEFAALNYTNPQKNQYAYYLENFDKSWNYAGNRPYTSYTNLPPGNYIFRVRGSNNDGRWNTQGASIRIIIQPPFWQTWWAYLAYVLLGAAILFVARKNIINRERLKTHLKTKELESAKLRELDKLKSDLFANISHEFRTPLSLISGTVQKLESEDEPQAPRQPDYKLIFRHTNRLLQLINQLLDLSKLESGKLALHLQPGELTGFLKVLLSSFTSLFQSKNICFAYQIPTEPLPARYDADKLEKILSNLLSNAYKFTPAHGKVLLQVGVKNKTLTSAWLDITVQDSGIGISEAELPRIFDRFHQVDASATRAYEGAGIGLALVKELVALQSGQITASSTFGTGTTFRLLLPLELIPATAVPDPEAENITTQSLSFLQTESEAPDSGNTPKRMTGLQVLVVEDNPDLRHFIRQYFSKTYQILEAANGLAGYNMALQAIPDLIISDVMMPEMDGVALCAKLKTDERTSHIPIILLTAKADTQTKLIGLQTGADDYLTKPFKLNELGIRVQNLIRGRQKLREHYGKFISAVPQEVDVTSVDEKFLQRALRIVEENMANADFDVEAFSREIGMSRAHLHRKLTALTDQSPNEFVKKLRLKRAASLLQKQQGNVSEVAYQVGFSSLNYFTRCFRECYGQTPSEYAQTASSIETSEK